MKSSVLLKGWQRSLGQAIANLDRAHSKALGNSKHKSRESGFTLIEVLILLLIVGILSAIAAPGWLAFINNQRLRTSQSQVYGAMQLAQSNAKRDKVSWEVRFRKVQRDLNNDGKLQDVIQWVVHPATTPLTELVLESNANSFVPKVWYNLEPQVDIETGGTAPTNLQPGSGTYIAIFNRQGCLVDKAENECIDTTTVPRRITLKHQYVGARRCVVIETLLGAMRTGDTETSCTP